MIAIPQGHQAGRFAFARSPACSARRAPREGDDFASGCASFVAVVQTADFRDAITRPSSGACARRGVGASFVRVGTAKKSIDTGAAT
jgi:hypothetical protein